MDDITKPRSNPYIEDDYENMAITPITERLKTPVLGLFVNGWYIYMNKTTCVSYQIHIVNPYTGRDHYKSDVWCNNPEEILSRWIDTELGRCLCYDNALLRVADIAMVLGNPKSELTTEVEKDENELQNR